MICSQCGAGPFEGKFCPKCGAPVAQPSPAPQPATPVATANDPIPATPASAQPAATPAPGASNANAEELKQAAAKASEAAKAAAAGLGVVVAGGVASAANKASGAISTARANQQKRAANIASGAAAQSTLGAGGMAGGLGTAGAVNASNQMMASAMTASMTSAQMAHHFFYDIKRNRRYFTKPDKLRPILTIIIGILLTVITIIARMVAAQIVGPILIIIGAIWLWWQVGRRPSDAEIDAMYARIAANGANEAASKSDLDEDERTIVDPMVFSGPSRDNVPASAHSHVGKDGITRWSNFQMSTVFCTENQLFYYAASQSLVITRREVTTMDVYYRDIALVEMREYLGGLGRMIIHTNSGDEFTIAYSHEQEESVRGLRALLREKKAHVVVELSQD